MLKARTDHQTVTLRDVADKAGVSIMTVSLALRPPPASDRMSPKTRDRVLAIAAELGYTPNARARALRLGRTNVLGLFMGTGAQDVRDPFYREVVAGVQQGCRTVNRDLLMYGTVPNQADPDFVVSLADGRVDGVMVTMAPDSPIAEQLANSNLAAVAIGSVLKGVPSVTVDDDDGARQLVRRLAERGHRRVFYGACPNRDDFACERRTEAFRRAAGSAGIQVTLQKLGHDLREDSFVREALGDGASAIICWSETAAQNLLTATRRLGVRVPEQLAVLAFGCGSAGTSDETEGLACVATPWFEVARTAVFLLDQLLRGEHVPHESVLPVTLNRGRTS